MKNNNKGMLRHQAVYLNSPMAIAVTEIYQRYQNVYNAEDAAMLNRVKAGSLHTTVVVFASACIPDKKTAVARLKKAEAHAAGAPSEIYNNDLRGIFSRALSKVH